MKDQFRKRFSLFIFFSILIIGCVLLDRSTIKSVFACSDGTGASCTGNEVRYLDPNQAGYEGYYPNPNSVCSSCNESVQGNYTPFSNPNDPRDPGSGGGSSGTFNGNGAIYVNVIGAPGPICVAFNGMYSSGTLCGTYMSAVVNADTFQTHASNFPNYYVTYGWQCWEDPNNPRWCGDPKTGSGSGSDFTVYHYGPAETDITITYHLINSLPKGYMDTPDCGAKVVRGWACDASDYSAALEVHMYLDKDAPALGDPNWPWTNNIANIAAEPAVAANCGGVSTHRFQAPMGNTADGYSHTAYGYAIDTPYPNQHTELSGSGTPYACVPTGFTANMSASPPPPMACGTTTATTTVTWHLSQPLDVYIYAIDDNGTEEGWKVAGQYGTDGSFQDTFSPTGRGYYMYIYQPAFGTFYNSGNLVTNAHVAATYSPCGDEVGSCDIANGLQVSGWACDPNAVNVSNTVAFNYDGTVGLGGTTANARHTYADGSIPPWIPFYCRDNYPNHGFTFSIPYSSVPAGMKGGPHTVYGYSYLYNPANPWTGGVPMARPVSVSCPNYVPPWIQTKGADVRLDPWTNDQVPSNTVCGSQPYMSVSNSNGTPGVIYGGSSNQGYGQGLASQGGYNWQVGSSLYPETFAPIRRTSVAYVRKALAARGITPVELSTALAATGRCNAYNSCDLTGLAGGTQANPAVYIASGNLSVITPTITFSGGTYIIIVTGQLTLQGEVHVTPGSNLTVLSSSLVIASNLGIAPTSCTPTANLEGFFSSDTNITLSSAANIPSNTPDKQLSVAGALVANAAKGGGSLINNRDLLGNNVNYPALVVTERPDLALTTPLVLESQAAFSKEAAP